MKLKITPNKNRRELSENDFIISKTDQSGCIIYANRIFMDIIGLPEYKLLNIQHNIVRHPDMPRGIFRFMWNTLKSGDEFFGFAKNLCADGSYYWVFANITPDYDQDGKLQGYHSVRRKPPQSALEVLVPVYAEMLAIEKRSSAKEGPDKSITYLIDMITQAGEKNYQSLVLDLYKPNKI